ncbi:unnamed protein product [Notodromas monacha]|uniref:C3H1-type domain-containing protein n=1 Tax=Notodromas monacha TaxID=399045 RepID=A0A7R9G8Z5_9CRUS|nr:unnamed protein product [Notodromas monacha]CAG0912304.1 unnamed protein product [Notodromas monacha]
MSDVEDGELTDGDEEPDSYRDVAAKDVSPISLSDLLKASSDAVEVTSYDQEFSELRSLTRDVAVVRGKRCDQSTEHRSSSTKSVDKKGASKRCDRQRRTQEYDHDSSKSQRDGRKRTRRNSSSEKRSFSVDKRNPDENWRSNQSSSNEFYDSDPNRNKSRAVCKYFLKGFCRRRYIDVVITVLQESECPFSHDVSALKREELCRFYLTTGGCRKRDSCLFMHEEFPCKYFHTGASCYAGGNCRFSHEPLNDFTKECLDKEAEGLDSAEEILNVAGPGFYVSNCPQILVLEEDKPQDLDLRFIVGAPPSNSFGAFDVDMRHGVLFPADEDLRVGLPSPRRMQAVEESPWDDSAVDSDVDEKPLVIDESGEPFDYSEFFLSCSTLLFSTAASSRPKTEAIANKINVESWTSMDQYTKYVGLSTN